MDDAGELITAIPLNPFLLALLLHGETIGAPIQRSRRAPWLVGTTIGTVVSAIRVGDLLINGAPGEPYPNIAAGVEEQTNVPAPRHWTLGLADDQLGYLIAPIEGWPAVAAQIAVNDNSIFNVSPTIGDHVMCAQIRMSRAVGSTTPRSSATPAASSGTPSTPPGKTRASGLPVPIHFQDDHRRYSNDKI